MPLSGSRDAPPPSSSVDVEVGRMQERMTSLSKDVTDGHARIDKNIDGLGAKLDKLADTFVGRPEFDGLKKTVEGHSTVLTWTWKTVGTAILLGILATIMKTGLHP